MGKPFRQELNKLKDTYMWALSIDIDPLRKFFFKNLRENLFCVGSGGSSSACALASLIYRELGGFSISVTPLAIQQMSDELICMSRLLYISASGNNRDIVQSLKRGLMISSLDTASLCTCTKNKIANLTAGELFHKQYHYDIPIGKDGFLATNSLLAFFVILVRAYEKDQLDNNINWASILGAPYEFSENLKLNQIENYIVVYGKLGEPIAIDIESKMSEAGLAAALISDYRNFGHGRHNWFDKKWGNSCIIAVITPEDELLAEKTLSNLPENLPKIIIRSKDQSLFACVELLIRSFYLIQDVGNAKAIDPGKPGVPDYGSTLYHLNYKKLLKPVFQLASVQDLAIQRKANVVNVSELSQEEYQFFLDGLLSFTKELNHVDFGMVAFDYDGTLSGTDFNSRHSQGLLPEVKKCLLRLLASNVKVAVISGRGKSIFQLLTKEFPLEYHHLVFIGHYNGLAVYPLDFPKSLESFKEAELEYELSLLRDVLIQTCPFVKTEDIEARQYQLTISARLNIDKIASRCQEIVVENNLSNIRLWKSSHSMDIVVYSIVDKRNIKKYYDGNILFIGDSGSVVGNDFQMLSEHFSLSVDKVSYNPSSCWNLAPHGCKGVAATLYYLKKMKLRNGCFNINLKV